jgi:hypothetical protein
MREHNFLYEEPELPPGSWEGNSVSQNQLLVVLKIQPRALYTLELALAGPSLFCCFCGWKGPSIVHNEMGVTLQVDC